LIKQATTTPIRDHLQPVQPQVKPPEDGLETSLPCSVFSFVGWEVRRIGIRRKPGVRSPWCCRVKRQSLRVRGVATMKVSGTP